MSTLASVDDFETAYEEGRYFSSTFRKIPTQSVSGVGQWADLSMAGGNPVPQYYAATPFEAKTLSSMRGIYHGVDQEEKRLTRFGLCSPTVGFGTAGRFKLLDYLLYYPYVDGDDPSPQPLDNTTAALTRYEDGAGVQVMAVALTPTAGGGTFTFDYINQDGVAKTSQVNTCGSSSNITNLMACYPATSGSGGPFLRLASGDSGIREITSVTFSTAAGGLFAFVLVQPLLDLGLYEINTINEINPLSEKGGYCPEILPGAYLNLIASPLATILGAILYGYAEYAWR